MAPEILNKTLNPNNFEEFKCADIYSFSLVLWEIINCIQLPTTNNYSKQIFKQQNNYLNCQSMSNYSSGIASGGGTTTTTITTLPFINTNNLIPSTNSIEIIKTSNSFSNNNISTISTSLNEINNLKEHQHKLPFELIVETDPSFDQMREIVCDKKIRPPILNEWKKEENLIIICNLMIECWSNWPTSRHKALKIKKEITKIIKNFNN
uniref:Uncharacterized protein n=1 Tax=Meloidogyne enterolobii TaxID=390850 RepID=A0A6V7XZI5_MELEN|nr:unnamed protein product [Meloidogyne enterolobii]